MTDVITVQVALRVRPLVDNEISRGCKKCLQSFSDANQVQVIGTDKAFSYNYVFDESISQTDFYNTAIQPMIDKLFKGYNVTILAYGQTGSGKTHSMGTNYSGTGEMGVIPRAVTDIFDYIRNRSDYEFKVTVSFMELYQENLYDLLSDRPRDQCVVDIREDTKGIKIPGLIEQKVSTTEETIKCLIDGSAGRATGATAMNAQSSRSHAIFTVTVYMQKKNDSDSATISKFHLVDLAGSERSKKTKATGERFKEGVNINRGLLALGNVISALGEDSSSKGYISYRDSKLTRLLQDSLGGNSITLMIACVSPADYNLEETISTLRYADRARKIKNKAIVNQDPKAAEITRLHQIIQQLRLERIGDLGGCFNNEETNKLREEVIRLQNRNRELNTALSTTLAENTSMFERALLTQSANERLQKKLLELKETYNITLTNLNMTLDQHTDCPNPLREHAEKFEFMKNMITDLHVEYKNHEEEIQKHEYHNATPHLNQHNSLNHDLHNSQPDLDEKQEIFTKEQLNLNTELKELNRVLSLKEQLASQIIANANHMVDYTALDENESKVMALEKEKDELLQQLKNAQTSNVSSKLSEQRRKRVKELETHISELKKKLVEQARMIKLKEKDELKIKQLNTEIQAMKATKVKLIKTMRSEEQRFREWKMQREKELMRLKDQDRKRQNQMARMENMHTKQQNVLKRKVEEAGAINKRLKDALAMQKQAQERRGNTGKTERVEQYVEQEMEVMVSRLEAKYTLDQLMEDRAMLTDQLQQLQEDPDVSRDTVQQLTDDIELRSAQIADLQQKILDSDPDTDDKAKKRWDTMQSMIDAKTALRKLFDLAGNISKKDITKTYKLEELNSAHDDALKKLNSYETQLKEQAIEHKHQISEIEREYEEKVAVVLRQLRGVTAKTDDENVKERLQIQEEALEKMDELRKELETYKAEVGNLRNKLSQVNSCALGKKKSSKQAASKPTTLLVDDLESSLEVDLEIDDQNDPDWRKTPLYKRILSMKSKTNISDKEERTFLKRSSDGTIKCNCKGNCSTKVCGCKKMNNQCAEQCKCLSENCVNRDRNKTNVAIKLFDDTEDSGDSIQKPTCRQHLPLTSFGQITVWRKYGSVKRRFGNKTVWSNEALPILSVQNNFVSEIIKSKDFKTPVIILR